MKIDEGTQVTLDLKTIAIIVSFVATVVGMWYALQGEIEEAKRLPEPSISRTEYDLKDKLVRETIMNTQYRSKKKMKTLLAIIAMGLSLSATAQITVVQINAKWNRSNTLTELNSLENCEYIFGWFEDQPHSVQSSIISVPVVVVYKDNIPKQQYAADISLKLNTTFEEIQSLVNSLKD
jgi:hypothetical protein